MDDKRNMIIAVAEQMYAHFGFKRTTMEEIAKKARIGKSTLYYYFKSKEEIFAEMIQKGLLITKQKLSGAINEATTPQEKIRNYVLTRMKHLQELINYYTTLTDEHLDHYFFVEQARVDFFNYESNTLKSLLNEGIELNLFDIKDIDTIVRMIIIALKGLEYQLFIQETDYDLETESNLMIDMIFKGIEKR
jgi:AcrR family transcriptional regulator